jgi:diazepam-binding inhibitor (GABA receptor modulating acyl-CoA-binding protein)
MATQQDDGISIVFRKAAEHATRKGFPKASKEDQLRLYALYKQVSGKPPAKPSAVDLVGRAKYDAWVDCRNMSRDEAQRSYVALVQSIDPAFVPGTDSQVGAAAQTLPAEGPVPLSPSVIEDSKNKVTHANSDLMAAMQAGVVVVGVDVPKCTDLEDDQGFRYTIYNIRVELSDGKIWTVGRRYTEVGIYLFLSQ